MSDPSIPAGTPMSMLQDERWDPPGGPEMTWNFPTGAGTYLVRLYFAEIYSAINAPGLRVFDVVAEGVPMLNDIDIYAMVGSNKAVAMSFSTAVADSFLTLTFVHGVENPTVFGIEIVPLPIPCCDPTTGACTLVPLSGCAAPSVWNGAASCSPNPCPQPMAACCTPEGSCTLTLAADCPAPNVWHGAGPGWEEWAGCAPNPCPPQGPPSGPNAGGVLIVHDTQLRYSYGEELVIPPESTPPADCAADDNQLPLDERCVWKGRRGVSGGKFSAVESHFLGRAGYCERRRPRHCPTPWFPGSPRRRRRLV